jgi:hypothetical protein
MSRLIGSHLRGDRRPAHGRLGDLSPVSVPSRAGYKYRDKERAELAKGGVPKSLKYN